MYSQKTEDKYIVMLPVPALQWEEETSPTVLNSKLQIPNIF